MRYFFQKKNTKINRNIKFGYIGRIEVAKGVFDLISAFCELQKLHPQVSLTIIGSGTAYKEVNSITQNIKSIKLISGLSQNNLAAHYSSFDYFIFPSHNESLGLAPIESLMCGTPVICSTIGAAKEYIKEDLINFSFEPGNVNELLISLDKAVLISSERYSELVSLSFRVASEYETKKVIGELITFFKDKFDD